MKVLLAVAILGAIVVLGISLLMSDRHVAPDVATTPGARTAVLRPVPAPRLTARQIDRQDRPDTRRQRDEAHAFDRRPLLSALPITLQSVRFEIGGLGYDGRTTIIRANAGGLGRRHAQIAYDTLRRRTGDRSRSYRLEIRP
ncbi:MAG: hypothetical protein QOJ89_4872 [bacterium]